MINAKNPIVEGDALYDALGGHDTEAIRKYSLVMSLENIELTWLEEPLTDEPVLRVPRYNAYPYGSESEEKKQAWQEALNAGHSMTRREVAELVYKRAVLTAKRRCIDKLIEHAPAEYLKLVGHKRYV
jgi:hypothetical protein